MNRQQFTLATILLFLLLGVGCQSSENEDELNGRVTVWHSWPAEETIVLEQALTQFQEIHPNVKIIAVSIPEDQILAEFHEAGKSGLAPDLLIGDDDWIGELVESGLIRAIAREDAPPSAFHLRNDALAQYEGKLYGVPLSLAPYALYYNTQLVDSPAATLDELLQHAEEGQRVAFVPRFEEAYWGIQAFGIGLFDEENNFTLAESGFTEWLTWLNDAQQTSGVILNVDDKSLVDLFASKEVAYYVAGPEKQGVIQQLLAEDDSVESASLNYGVTPLPEGPMGKAGPLLPAETILLYAFSSDSQMQNANALMAYLVNQQQGIRFMRELQRVPANTAVRVDSRIYPIVYGFSQQAQTAVVLPNEFPSSALVEAGDRAYVNVLSGVLTPEEAVCRFGEDVSVILDGIVADISWPEWCVPTDNE